MAKETAEKMRILNELIAEKKECEKLIKQADDAKKRLDELLGYGFVDIGLIKKAKQDYEDSKWPVFIKKYDYEQNKRIVNVDKKWIYIKADGFCKPIQYSIVDGRKINSRNNYLSIDHKKALEIWEKFKNENK
jgi:hypothetical protein